jgi:hypothetical protein
MILLSYNRRDLDPRVETPYTHGFCAQTIQATEGISLKELNEKNKIKQNKRTFSLKYLTNFDEDDRGHQFQS